MSRVTRNCLENWGLLRVSAFVKEPVLAYTRVSRYQVLVDAEIASTRHGSIERETLRTSIGSPLAYQVDFFAWALGTCRDESQALRGGAVHC